jgi:hypothetical protein
MIGTIITGVIFGGCSVAALLVMKRDHSAERIARKKAIDEATEPWRALYEEKTAELDKMREQYEQTLNALRKEIHRADMEIARWNYIGMALKGKDVIRTVQE